LSQARLVALLRERSVRRGRVVLASGRESDVYVDVRLTTLHAEGAAVVAALVWERLRPEILGVGGPSLGADPIAGAVAALSWRQGRPVHGFLVRKEPKAHGQGLWIEGRANLPDSAPVCVVEDTVTTGGSLLRAIRRVQDDGLAVAQCLAVVDRGEGAAAALAAEGHVLESLVRIEELL
jgi:orotate phosphoribosyltransferase